MTLKEQIEKTIAAYEEACKKENLNYEYCNKNYLHKGICYYTQSNKYYFLNDIVYKKFDIYMTTIPQELNKHNIFFKFSLYKVHKARIKFLKQLLKEVTI